MMISWPAAAATASGGMLPRQNVSTYPATAAEWTLYLCTGSGGVVNLPTGGAADFELEIINDSSGTVTLTPASGQTITGLSTYSVPARETSVRLRWCGGDYQIV
jgi:hypothetical protein